MRCLYSLCKTDSRRSDKLESNSYGRKRVNNKRSHSVDVSPGWEHAPGVPKTGKFLEILNRVRELKRTEETRRSQALRTLLELSAASGARHTESGASGARDSCDWSVVSFSLPVSFGCWSIFVIEGAFPPNRTNPLQSTIKAIRLKNYRLLIFPRNPCMPLNRLARLCSIKKGPPTWQAKNSTNLMVNMCFHIQQFIFCFRWSA